MQSSFIQYLMHKKNFPDDPQQNTPGGLKKTLNAFNLMLLGLGAIIGSGIFVITGMTAAKYTGPAIIVSFGIAAILTIFVALTYVELATLIPASGGPYAYAYATLGHFAACILGWNTLVTYTFAGAMAASGWAGYATEILSLANIHIPLAFRTSALEGGIANIPAVFIIILLTAVSLKGNRFINRFNAWLVFAKLLAIFAFLFLAIPRINATLWMPFAPFGVPGIIRGAGVLFLAFAGFDVIATAAEECKNPNRDIPIGIIGSVFLSALLYILVGAALTGICKYSLLATPHPITSALKQYSIELGKNIVAIGALAGLITVVLSTLFATARILIGMSRDSLAPEYFTKLDSRYATPYRGLIAGACVMIILTSIFPIVQISEILALCFYLSFMCVCICVMLLRIQQPNKKRTFKCPAVFIVAPLTGLACLYLFLQGFTVHYVSFLSILSIGPLCYLIHTVFKTRQQS